jgi:Na+/proline symporter
MSNLSGSLNSLASTTVLDFYQPLAGRHLADGRLLAISRWLTAFWGVALMGIAVLARNWGSVFTAGLTIASIVYGPMLGAFLLGVLTRRATGAGAMAGMGVSLAAMIAVRLFTPLAWTWYVVAGTAVCTGVGLMVSLMVSFGE